MSEASIAVNREFIYDLVGSLEYMEYYGTGTTWKPITDNEKLALSRIKEILKQKANSTGMRYPKEYSDTFDVLRKNRVEVSMHKYGSAADNFGRGLVSALGSHDLCMKKYQETGNTEYLLDAANYLMFEFMYPQLPGAFFCATSEKESAGIVGQSKNQLSHEEKRFNYFLERIADGKMD